MPAVLVIKAQSNPGQGGAVWKAGEVIQNFEQTHQFGWFEMPLNYLGDFTVAQINAQDVPSLALYATVRCTDAGTVTSGSGADVEVVADDVLVKQFGDVWVNFGPRDAIDTYCYQIRISDRTVEEVNVYLEAYNKKLSYVSDQFDPATDTRRFTTTNERVSASGNNGFTEQGILDTIAEWNTNYPANTLTLVDTDNLTYFQCDGIMPNELFGEWQEITQKVALADYYARRRWYITQAGMDALANNDGLISGTAADVNPFLRDGLLD